MRLLFDLGNTRLKWAVQDGDAWLASDAIGWEQDLAAALSPLWQSGYAITRVLAASVVSADRQTLLEQLIGHTFHCAVEWVQTPASALGVHNAYAEPGRLGIDRFLAMADALASGAVPCVRVGVGTALTLDALDRDGQHRGGLIAPGPALMQQSLLHAAARIQLDRAGELVDLADNTTDAVISGCWQAAAALIERFARRAAKRLSSAPAILIDGGDADRLLGLLELPAQRVYDGVLRGLARWADAFPPLAGP